MKETKINISAFQVSEASLFLSGVVFWSAFEVHKQRASMGLASDHPSQVAPSQSGAPQCSRADRLSGHSPTVLWRRKSWCE